MNESYLELDNEIKRMNAAVSVYDEILHTKAKSEIERENVLLKLELIKNEILKTNMSIKKTIGMIDNMRD